jgi:hypothetical protein
MIKRKRKLQLKNYGSNITPPLEMRESILCTKGNSQRFVGEFMIVLMNLFQNKFIDLGHLSVFSAPTNNKVCKIAYS